MSAINLLLAWWILEESLKEKKTEGPLFDNPISGFREALSRGAITDLLIMNLIFITAFSLMTVSVTLLWEEHYGLNEAQVGYTFAFMGLVAAIVQGGLVGWASRTFGDKRLLIYGSILMFFGLVSLPFVPVSLFIPLELLALVLISLGNGALTPTISSLLSRVASPQEQGKVLGYAQSFSSLGRVIGPFLGGGLYGIGYRLPNIGSGVLMILCLVLAFRLVRRVSKS